VRVNGTAFLLLTLALVAAVLDWFAVGTGRRGLEYVAKPLTLVALLFAAAALDADSSAVQHAFLVALGFSLAGDVLLLLPDEPWFVFGLGAFFVAHVAYIVGFWIAGVQVEALLVGLVVVVIAIVVLGRRIVAAVADGDDAALVAPVAAYIGIISLMVASAIGTRDALAIAGAVLFYVSDATIAWTRFIRDHPWGRMSIIVTYHVAQFALVLSLV
jgi:uncharacterized membrane protein YhhN